MNYYAIRHEPFVTRFSYLLLVLFLVFLPFDRFYSELTLVLLLVHTILHLRKPQLARLSDRRLPVLASVWIITVICTSYSADPHQAFSFWTRQLAIILIPLILLADPSIIRKYRDHFLSAFAIVCTGLIAYLYIDALRILYFYGLPLRAVFSSNFINHNFSAPVGLHATYLSMYAGLSWIYLLTALYRPSAFWKKAVVAVFMLLLTAGLIQLGSRSVLIALLLAALIVFPAVELKRRKRMGFIILSCSILSIAVITLARVNTFKDRLYTTLLSDLAPQESPYSVADPRMERWKLAAGLIRAAPVLGYGTGEETDLLKERYFEHGLYNSYLYELNAHNEYLSFLLRGGIVALLVYLFTLGYGFRQAFQTRDTVFLGFLLLIAVVSLSENFLDVNKGIFFYAFFFSFFLLGRSARATPAS